VILVSTHSILSAKLTRLWRKHIEIGLVLSPKQALLIYYMLWHKQWINGHTHCYVHMWAKYTCQSIPCVPCGTTCYMTQCARKALSSSFDNWQVKLGYHRNAVGKGKIRIQYLTGKWILKDQRCVPHFIS